MIANGMKAVAGKAYLLISGLTPLPQARKATYGYVQSQLTGRYPRCITPWISALQAEQCPNVTV
jgi:hypothetical protein